MHLQWAWHVLVLKILFRIQQPFTLLLCLGANMLANLWGFVQNIIWFSQAAHVTGHLESFIHLRKVTTRFWRKRWIGRMKKKTDWQWPPCFGGNGKSGERTDRQWLPSFWWKWWVGEKRKKTGSDHLVLVKTAGQGKETKDRLLTVVATRFCSTCCTARSITAVSSASFLRSRAISFSSPTTLKQLATTLTQQYRHCDRQFFQPCYPETNFNYPDT